MIAIAPIKSLPDGSVATIPMSWADYQQLAASRGDRSTPRLKYADGYLSLKMPTFEHGQLDAIVADLLVAILNQQLRDYVRTTPVTLQIPEQAGIEPDHCFWLNNWAAVSGKSRIDLAADPPPDIAVEIEVTNFTNIADYELFNVPEVWLIRGDVLAIFALASGRYTKAESSQFFPDTAIPKLYHQVMAAIAEGASPPRAIRSVII
ncbi:Uma2 family endonuclease [Oscillatoria sp. CS-180]|uniref:Uma2 family endonuclease n=1 Tax=Oscillatoria sp. CS-180 TaxID=3021720 RepID=UPI00232F36C3|nr:Uma2 family endonuclease [Oscillatoria sp. CS-180]MDB9524765.1 Uma2 family endonuclease [Oscillatoria sp. CS-180]